jgi:Zn-dependent peptidase ImmA (M78 family)/DNA-binding XRE family transcriptional regulator
MLNIKNPTTMTSVLGSNLTTARRIAGLTMQQLADKSSLSKQSISRYEKGEMPGSEAVIKLADALELPHDFLFKTSDLQSKIFLANLSLREGDNITKDHLEEIKVEAIDFLARLIELEKLADNKQDFKNPIEDVEICTSKDVEKAAKKLRRKWNIGNFQIPNVVELLESKGICIYEVKRSDKFNGFAAWAGSIPIIVINSGIKEVTRIRFTTLHELGHIVLKFIDHLDEHTKEKFCDAFSAELLFSNEALVHEFGNKRITISVEELRRVKEKYGISITALMRSLYKAKVINLAAYKNWYSSYEQWVLDGIDLGKYGSEEKPQRFKLLLYSCLMENRISIEKAAALTKMKEKDLRKAYELVNLVSAN